MKRFALAVLGLAGLATAATLPMLQPDRSKVDEFLPVPQRSFELDLGAHYAMSTGAYDSEGDLQDLANDADQSATMIPVTLKVGLMEGLDLEAGGGYTINSGDLNDETGFDRPFVGAKYAMRELGVGALAQVDLPVGTEEIVGVDPTTSIRIGALFAGKFMEQFQVFANTSYTFNLEDDNKFRFGDVWEVFVKPEFLLTPKFGLHVVANWAWMMESQVDGDALTDSDAYLLTLSPGAMIPVTELMSLEAHVPFTVMGQSAPGSWGLSAKLFLSFLY